MTTVLMAGGRWPIVDLLDEIGEGDYVSNITQVEPFGLTFRVPVPHSAVPSEAVRAAVYDQQRQMALFNGRPLSELSAQEQMNSSSPTETDGKDPISVDSDPFYD